MQRAPPEMQSKLFKKGDKIEIRMLNGVVVWRPATFIGSSIEGIYAQFEIVREAGDQMVEFRREYVGTGDVRPVPPTELHRYLKVGEMVEGFCREKKGWRKGHVVEILENSRYTVSFEDERRENSVAKMEQWELRAFREWADGCWIPPFLLQEILQKKTSESGVKSRGLILKIKCSGKASEPKFVDGMLVEIKSDEEGFRGSLYVAVIVKANGNDKFLVEYRTLRNEEKTELLKEEVDISCIRHCPPAIQRLLPFEYLERVDAWYNDGWWEGYVAQVLNGCKYTVHFNNTDEVMVFEHCNLRPHQEWINGKWSAVPKVNLTDVDLRMANNKGDFKRKRGRKALDLIFKDGMVVEVKSDEEGYQGSWYTAVIVSSLCGDQFLVEYQGLKTEDEAELLREKAFASYIRPCPPEIVRVDRFKMLEEVDAWYNDGWWVGLVSKVLDGLKYAVYFWTTDEEIAFDHFSLRPHQEWIGGKWILSFRQKTKRIVKNKLGKCNTGNDEIGLEQIFSSGTRVEVKSDEPGYTGSWYPAAIVKNIENRKYLVEYLTLNTDDEDDEATQLQKEEVDALCIRPCPPVVQRKLGYKPFEEVDAWYNDGWWVGRVYQALEGRKYMIYFHTTNEILEFQHLELRPHRDWINGKWAIPKTV